MTFTEVGYSGGKTQNATYEDVCGGSTGHAEAVLINYDPTQVSLSEILNQFWKINPANLSGNAGGQYRSAIFYFTEEQRAVAESEKNRLEKLRHMPIFTEIAKAGLFWRAEEYHQNYSQKHSGRGSMCR